MAEDETYVDTLSLLEFHRHMRARLDEAESALTALTTDPGAQPPALGDFHDAKETGARHRTLHDEYVRRLRRLVNALTAVQTATGLFVQDYRTAEQLNSMGAAQVSDAMRPVGEALYGGRRDA
ncbi:hypothetical protein Val02_58950 [Virgisporangium aliadipatigenens]|uniref:Uncharacterized protein n=1 Tax=Virgisporangium aliadipatigenens TaxID=741659 RepID=A0A8J3YNU4_9ACTN|nr:hypothetical protein [Virgisporangium aliadipatigenens]GIJ49009.1 hypothetical protein Val02_58950 [Virgisporangium aliadipatigenens]